MWGLANWRRCSPHVRPRTTTFSLEPTVLAGRLCRCQRFLDIIARFGTFWCLLAADWHNVEETYTPTHVGGFVKKTIRYMTRRTSMTIDWNITFPEMQNYFVRVTCQLIDAYVPKVKVLCSQPHMKNEYTTLASSVLPAYSEWWIPDKTEEARECTRSSCLMIVGSYPNLNERTRSRAVLCEKIFNFALL